MATACLLAGCASAAVDPSGLGGPDPDAPSQPDDGPDVDPPDSPGNPNPQAATLSQTTNNTVAVNNSAQCSNFDGNGNVLLTHENSWYRVFSLAEAGITGSFTVSKVTFAVEIANNEPPVTVKVGTYSGTPNDTAPLSLAQATFLATTTVAVANTQAAVSLDANIAATIPANSNLIVEISSSDHATNGDGFILGTTNGPFQHTAYLRSGTCGLNEPTAMAQLPGCPTCGSSQGIISVSGTH